MIIGDWYWVKRKGKPWFPAKYDPKAEGKWTNEDTWEDFNHEVIAFSHIVNPA